MTVRELIVALEQLSEDKKDLRVYTENYNYIDHKAQIVEVGLSFYYDHPNRSEVIFLIQA